MTSMPVQFHANQIQFRVLLIYSQLKGEKVKKKKGRGVRGGEKALSSRDYPFLHK